MSTVFETRPNPVSGNLLMGERLADGGFRLTIIYPVSIGGAPVVHRSQGIVLDADDEERLRAVLGTHPVTRVMFRKFRDGSGDIIALFPDLPGDTHNPGMCESYMHNGQHGAADLTGAVYQLTSPARPEEFAALKAELEAPLYGYRLKIVLRTPKDSAELRARALRRPS